MSDKFQRKLPLEEALCYWKAYNSVHDVLASELSYSLIYDNIHPNKIGDALATVGLETLPNRFFLIQVDDYQNYASKLRLTQEFFQKTSLIHMLRECMRDMGLSGFTANMIGQDNITCFLCCNEREDEHINEYLLSVAEEFKKRIRTRSAYTISVCISQRCVRMVQYSRMYPRMNLALSKTYFTGKEVNLLLENIAQEEEGAVKTDLNEHYPELLVSISRHNREHFEQALQEIMRTLLEAQTQPQRARLELIRLIQRLGEYCVRCGVPEKKILAYNETAMNRILTCSFVADTRICFREYYEQVAQALEEYSTDTEFSFKAPVEEYVAEHYHDAVRLADLAEMLGFSEGHFARIFRKHFGMTFVQYLTEYRIGQSKRLLAETQIPIEQIAYRVGINSYSYFCTCFKRACGLSPGGYRGRARASEREEQADAGAAGSQ